MRDRRQFLAGSVAAAALRVTGAAQTTDGSGAKRIEAPDRELLAAMQRRLTMELGDEAVAKGVAGSLLEVGFHWRPAARPAAEIKSIVGYSFGNRLPAAGVKQALPDPGPVNAALAEAVWQLHERSKARLFVQWEIGRELKRKHPEAEIFSVEPVVAKDGSVTYLSTDGVAEAVVREAGGAAKLGVVGVIGHRDHAKRCVLTSRARGMDACVAREVVLPVGYDAESGQPWTRRRELYLVHDLAAQFAMLRAELIAKEFPGG